MTKMEDNILEYPNKTIRLLLERASCRTYKPDAVPDDVLDLVLKAGVSAPSAGNLQPFSIIKVREDAARAKITEMMGQSFIGESPVLLLFCLDFNRLARWAALESAPFTADHAFRHFWVGFQDVAIWEHKRWQDEPMLCDGDGPIGDLRKWYAQFYQQATETG